LLGRVEESIDAWRRFLDRHPTHADARSNRLLALNYHPSVEATAILDEAREWNRLHGESALAGPSHANDPTLTRRLRIGYFSADFRTVSVFLPHVLAEHDRGLYEIFCYSGTTGLEGAFEKLRRQVDHFREVGSLGDAALAAAIADDEIDVLVDVTMHM